MDEFEKLFGIKRSEVKRNCVLIPVVRKEILKAFRLKRFSKGRLYGAGNSQLLTLIHTRIGPTFLGDAVLHLAETSCQNLFFLGACGVVPGRAGLKIGDLVSPTRCYSQESFTDLLLGRSVSEDVFCPDQQLHRDILQVGSTASIRGVTCLSIGSLKLQTEKVPHFISKGIQVVDMECAAFFAASRFIGRRSVALFVVIDIIGEKPFYRDFQLREKLSLFNSLSRAVKVLCKLIPVIEERPSG